MDDETVCDSDYRSSIASIERDFRAATTRSKLRRDEDDTDRLLRVSYLIPAFAIVVAAIILLTLAWPA